ncbi:hypothetical protein Moror_12946 [Moniliophthora roreri MCA 2997]|uniref:Uncharacterized protein n=1 Tax=Moniliophthora roreri (strain MCA 2997) TaxID=1381753 RepID=V2X482_MONRO|nr:hypothetical protein Moror_12946 [Moniliophthora roreri MCA 2997]
MLQGNMDFPALTKDLLHLLRQAALNKNIPIDLVPKQLLKQDTAIEQMESEEQIAKFPAVTKLRQPLFLVLAVSPLILLSEIMTTSTNFNQVQMTRAWFHFGNQRPPILTRIEGMLWLELFAMACGNKSSIQALTSFLDKLLPLLPTYLHPHLSDNGVCAVMPIGISYEVTKAYRPPALAFSDQSTFPLLNTNGLETFLQSAGSQSLAEMVQYALSAFSQVSHPQYSLSLSHVPNLLLPSSSTLLLGNVEFNAAETVPTSSGSVYYPSDCMGLDLHEMAFSAPPSDGDFDMAVDGEVDVDVDSKHDIGLNQAEHIDSTRVLRAMSDIDYAEDDSLEQSSTLEDLDAMPTPEKPLALMKNHMGLQLFVPGSTFEVCTSQSHELSV